MDDPFDLPPDVLRRIPLFAEIAKVLSWQGGPVNWDLARQVAVSVAAGDDPQPQIDAADHHEVEEQVRLAEMWLIDESAMQTPGRIAKVRAATVVEWAEHSTEAFRELIDPVAAKVTRAMADQAPTGGEGGVLAQALGQMAPMFTGIQAGTVLGALAREVLGDHEVGLPAAESDLLLVLPAIDQVAIDYRLDIRSARQWVALRAAAHRMHIEGFPWVRARFFSLYHDFVSSLDIDLADGIQRLQQLDLSDPSRLQEALGDEGLFAHQPSAATAAASARVSRFLAMVDAHTTVAADAAASRMGSIGPIVEAFARRSAEPGRGAQMLADFIGLAATRDRRGALGFARTIAQARGIATLNKIWEDADTFPSDEEIADPDAWLRRTAS